MPSIRLAYTANILYILTNKLFNCHNIYSHKCIYMLSICITYSVHTVVKVNCGYQCAFCMAKSVVPPTFLRRSIGNHAQLSPTPISDHVQLFRDHAQLHPALKLSILNQINLIFYPYVLFNISALAFLPNAY